MLRNFQVIFFLITEIKHPVSYINIYSITLFECSVNTEQFTDIFLVYVLIYSFNQLIVH